MDKVTELKAGIAAVVAVLTSLWGWFGWLVVGLVGCMVLDYATGTVAAMRKGDWASRAARDGLWHKLGCIVAVGVAVIADMLIGAVINHIPGIVLPFEYGVLVAPVVVVWYILTELGSIAENAAAMGAPVPSFLLSLLRAGQAAVDAAGDKIAGDGKDEGK